MKMETNNINLSDNEIKKALECCIDTTAVNCGECPYCEDCVSDENTSHIMTDALALINRQQAEIERLEKGSLKEAMTFNLETIAKASKEAIKEFAHKIESYKTGIFIKGEELIILPLCDFEDIKSEMVGEDK